jgi:hypothetical protein
MPVKKPGKPGPKPKPKAEPKEKPKAKPKRKGNWYNPSKYTDKMCSELVELMSEGKSRAHFCAAHNISQITFDAWRKDHPEFDDAYQVAQGKSEVWWQDMAQKHLTYNSFGTQLNPVIWSMNMRNRFGWTEHRRVSVPQLSTAKTFKEKFDVLTKHIENGKLTTAEVTALSSLLAAGVKIAESAEILEKLERLEASVEQSRNESINKAETGKN